MQLTLLQKKMCRLCQTLMHYPSAMPSAPSSQNVCLLKKKKNPYKVNVMFCSTSVITLPLLEVSFFFILNESRMMK